MLQHAARVIPPLPLSALLHTAAGRAYDISRGVASINANNLSPSDILAFDPTRSPPSYIPDTLLPNNPSSYIISSPPTTPSALHQSLLRLLSYHPISSPTLPTLLSYHLQQSDRSSSPLNTSTPPLRSTRSYNLLISLALRHAALGSAGRLLRSMRVEGVRGDVETWKLAVRWLVRSGRWTTAWNEVMNAIGWGTGGIDDGWPLHYGMDPKGMPLSVWEEFLGTTKRGAVTRQHTRRPRKNRQGMVSQLEADTISADLSRYQILCRYSPSLNSIQAAHMPSRVVHSIIQMMLRTHQHQSAKKLTLAYLTGGPPMLDNQDQWVRRCLDIVHLHIIHTKSAKNVLRTHYRIRRQFYSLLDAQPHLQPNSTTLFLLLRSLRRTRRCGTIALQLLHQFRQRWGPVVEDMRVRRRVASLAVKEGRWDIARMMLDRKGQEVRTRKMWRVQREVLGGAERDPSRYRKLLRAPWRKIFRRRGPEGRKWMVLRTKVRRQFEKSVETA